MLFYRENLLNLQINFLQDKYHPNLFHFLCIFPVKKSCVEKQKEVILTALPLYHIFAFTVNLLSFYWMGSHNILIPNPRPLSNLKRAFENYKITWMSGVNTLFNGLTNEVWFIDTPPKHMKFAGAGGMALQSSVAAKWREITGTEVLQGYGLTETSPVLTFEPLGKARPGTIGVPIPGTEVTCLGEDGQPVPQGEPGEIAARGPQIMKGYWNRPDETEKVMLGDWFLTGDIGVMDAEGYVSIVDRKKDMGVVSGFNVYPNEIEDCLALHPGILESAVIGVPHPDFGETPVGVLARQKGATPDEPAILQALSSQLARFKHPRRLVVVDELPRNTMGKVQKNILRDTYKNLFA